MSVLAELLDDRHWDGAVGYVPPGPRTLSQLQSSVDHATKIVDLFHGFGRAYAKQPIASTVEIQPGQLASLLVERRWEGDPSQLSRIAKGLGKRALAQDEVIFDRRARALRDETYLVPGAFWIHRFDPDNAALVGVDRILVVRDAATQTIVGRPRTGIQAVRPARDVGESPRPRGKPVLSLTPNTVLSDMTVDTVYAQDSGPTEPYLFWRVVSGYILGSKPGDLTVPPQQRQPSQS